MSDKLEAPYGPWSELFSGTWAGYEMHVYENPDRFVLTLIYDSQAGAVKGIVTIMNRFYVAESDVSRLAAELGGHSFVLEKNYPTAKARFFSISSGPKYVAPEGLSAGVEATHSTISAQSDQLSQLSKGYGIVLTDLKYAPPEVASRLFAEPVLAAGLVAAADQPRSIAAARVVLGKKITGEDAEETLQSFAATAVIGSQQSRRQAVRVLLENCVLGGITAFAFDDEGAFGAMTSPNKGFDYKAYPNLQPIGMPVKDLKPGMAAIDLNLLSTRMFREVAGVPAKEGEYAGRAAAEAIDGVIEENRRRIASIGDLEERLLSVKDEAKGFHTYRAVRIVRVLRRALPGMLGGQLDFSPLISPYAKSTGSINRLDAAGLPSNLKKAFAYSLLRSLYEKYKEEPAQLKVLVFFANGSLVAPQRPAGALDAGLLEMLAACSSHGVGFCLGAENAIDLNQQIVDKATIRIDFVSPDEMAVRGAGSRPYRARLRPALSA